MTETLERPDAENAQWVEPTNSAEPELSTEQLNAETEKVRDLLDQSLMAMWKEDYPLSEERLMEVKERLAELNITMESVMESPELQQSVAGIVRRELEKIQGGEDGISLIVIDHLKNSGLLTEQVIDMGGLRDLAWDITNREAATFISNFAKEDKRGETEEITAVQILWQSFNLELHPPSPDEPLGRVICDAVLFHLTEDSTILYENGVVNALARIDDALKVIDEGIDLPDEIMQVSYLRRTVFEIFRSLIRTGSGEAAEKLATTFFGRDSYLQNQELRGIVVQALETPYRLLFAGYEQKKVVTDEISQRFRVDREELEKIICSVAIGAIRTGEDEVAAGIDKAHPLPANIYYENDYRGSVIAALRVNIGINETASLHKIVSALKIPDDLLSEADVEFSKLSRLDEWQSPDAVVGLLKNEAVRKLFPITTQTFELMAIRYAGDSPTLANQIIENLDHFHNEWWAQEAVFNAVTNFDVARSFVYAVDHGASWAGESWVPKILEICEQVSNNYRELVSTNEVTRSGLKIEHEDPHAEHIWHFKEGEQRRARAILAALNGEVSPDKLVEAGVKPELIEVLPELIDTIHLRFSKFMDQILDSEDIPYADKVSICMPEHSPIPMTPIWETFTGLVARYFAQAETADIKTLETVILMGFEDFIRMYKNDIPLYDKVYDEFDQLRADRRYPLEVYLGRDGIYAYVGRRAQDVARRRAIGPAGRRAAREQGVKLEVHPEYVVYPRDFKNLPSTAKLLYLEDSGVTPKADPIFYDTGFSGTVPEDIMKVMGFSRSQIEERIRLLSAESDARRLRALNENAPQPVVGEIEDNAKDEESAGGVYMSNSKLVKHYARPTSPDEQFRYLMIKEAITRHYWLTERLRFLPDEAEPATVPEVNQ